MLIIPAIDIKDGKCVRLFMGLEDRKKEYFENPVDAAKLWIDQGAERLHVVDLDGAFAGRLKNLSYIEKICGLGVDVEVGGGIRDKQTLKSVFDSGAAWAVLGTIIVDDFDLFESLVYEYPESIIAGIDAKYGRVVIKGWRESLEVDVITLAKKVERLPISSIIFTEVSRDGTLMGAEFELTSKLVNAVDVPVIASGGVSSISDIDKLKSINVYGVIIGKALYEGKLSLKEVIERVRDAG